MNIAIFVSGSGTNCENIIRYFANHLDVNVALVLSNKADAYALVRAKKYNIPTVVMPKADFAEEDKLMSVMRDYHIDFIVLAGFLLMVPDFLIDAYEHRMLNIHPALLPKYGGRGMYGMHVHEAVKGEPCVRWWRNYRAVQHASLPRRYSRRYCCERACVGTTILPQGDRGSYQRAEIISPFFVSVKCLI